MVSKFWMYLIVIGSCYLVLCGKVDILNEQILASGKVSLELAIQIFPLISLWLGIMEIAKSSGLLSVLSRFIEPLISPLFPDLPRGHEAFGYISSNLIANLFGLGNAATPFGIKAMESMQKINSDKTVASKSMITFLVMNTVGFTLIPTTIISLRMMHKSLNPSAIILPCIIVSFLSLLFGLIIDRIFSRK